MSARRGWKEPVEDGIRRAHRVSCPRSTDHKAGRKCGCPFEIKKPGKSPRATSSETFQGTLTEARQRRRMLLSMGRPATETPQSASITVHQYATQWLRDQVKDGYAASTIEGRSRAYRLHIAPYIGGIELEALTRKRLGEWVRQMKANDPGHRAMELAVENLRAMLNIAVRDELIERNPADGLDVGTAPPRRDRDQQVLDIEQYGRLLAACRSLSQVTLIRCATEGMLRRGEITALQWRDIDFAGKRIHIRTSVFQNKRGKHVGPPKSGDNRKVALGTAAWEELERYRAEAIAAGHFGPTAYVWPGTGKRGSTGGTKPFEMRSPSSTYSSISKIIRRAGLVDDGGRTLVTLHGLRKTGGSIALSRGVPMIVVQHQMGHSKETTTANHYAFLLNGKELDRIGDVFADLGHALSPPRSHGVPGRT